MNRTICLFLIALLFLVPALCFCEEERPPERPPERPRGDVGGASRKDPILAGALSWYVPGLGQMYSGAIFKGAAFFIVEEALLAGLVLTFAEIELDPTGGIGLGINIKSKSNPDKDDQRNAVIFGLSLITIHFINVIDAVNTTRKHNRSLEPHLTAKMKYNEEGSAYALTLNKPF